MIQLEEANLWESDTFQELLTHPRRTEPLAKRARLVRLVILNRRQQL